MNKIVMYLGSMDHSPSEQLEDPDIWHTTVLLLSETGQHWELAKNVAQRLGCRDAALSKWSRNPPYRGNGSFEVALSACLPEQGVYVRIISAKGRAIRRAYPELIGQLGLAGLVATFNKNEKPYLRFGPFTRVKIVGADDKGVRTESEPAYFDIVERQALPFIFICHYVFRMHQQITAIAQKRQPEIEWIDWQLMPNKFPGDVTGPMGSVFHAITSGAAQQRLVTGNVRIMTFSNAKEDLGSSLADNIAGWAADKLSSSQRAFMGSDSIQWEIWTEPEFG